MPRPASATAHRTSRSKSATRAHAAGVVTGTIDLCTPSATTVRERAATVAARNSLALAIIATTLWIYDIALVLRAS